MEELLNKVSDETGVPSGLLDRAVRARAAVRGVAAEVVAAQWAGEPVPEASAAAPAAPAPAAPAPAAAAPTPEPEAPSGPVVEVLEPMTEAPAPGIDAEPEPETATAAAGFPGWLAAAFVVIPVLALAYALLAPNGPNCGTAGALGIDPVSGEAANCDGSAYGVDIVDFFTLGQALYETNCVACHGAAGQGGTGPALAGGSVVGTFPSCTDHIDWVTVGTSGWTELTGRSTYGATDKPVGGSGALMPAFGSGLSDSELRQVVLYERVAFGQELYADASMECGLDESTLAAG